MAVFDPHSYNDKPSPRWKKWKLYKYGIDIELFKQIYKCIGQAGKLACFGNR